MRTLEFSEISSYTGKLSNFFSHSLISPIFTIGRLLSFSREIIKVLDIFSLMKLLNGISFKDDAIKPMS